MLNHILMIDDDPDDIDFFLVGVADLLPQTIVRSFGTAASAIEHLTQCQKDEFPEIIFMDINLPIVNGWECLREIKRMMTSRHIPVVMFSSLDFKSQGLTPSDVGATAFMTKPDSIAELKNNLSSLFHSLFPDKFRSSLQV